MKDNLDIIDIKIERLKKDREREVKKWKKLL